MISIFSRLTVLLTLVLAGACSGDGGDKTQPPVPVRAAPVVEKDTPRTVAAVGEVEPIQSALVTPQVNGILKEVRFTEGHEVRVGDLLVVVDPAPYEAELAQAQAQLQRNKAQLESARAQLARMEMLVQKDFVSREQYDETKATAGALAGSVKADEAALKNAQIRLDYCYVRSPISGRAGALLLKPGNVVTANDPRSAIVRVNQLKPVHLRFSIPETLVDDVRSAQAEAPRKVFASRTGSSALPVEGTLTFIDNSVDRNTGTLMLKATFSNEDEVLWPGEFLEVTLEIGIKKNAVVLPVAAMQTGQQGDYVYVVKSDETVELRVVKLDFRSETEAIVSSGVTPGEVVVTDGHIRLFSGAKVEVKK